MNNRIKVTIAGALLVAVVLSAGAFEASLNDLSLTPGTYWNGSDLAGGFTNHDVFFRNSFDTNWLSWSGFAYSTVNDTNTPGYGNQYACVAGSGVGGTGVYAVVYDSAWAEDDVITLPLPALVSGFYVNNTTYAALAMRDGYLFGKKFGGTSSNEPDWFLLTIIGKDAGGCVVGSVEHYLADFRSPTNADDYIQSDWQWVDLAALGPTVKTLHFALSSSDTGDWGMNTPAYFAMDNLQVIYAPPAGQDHSTALYMDTNLFVAWATGWTNYSVGGGVSNQFATPEKALGPATDDAFDVVSLGNGGMITMSFDVPIADGPGFDFAVFENAVADTFLELAWVEVSSDGTNFTRFPNHSLTPGSVPAFGEVYTTNIGGLAGKYVGGYGTPFDLRDLKAGPDLDVMNIRWVRVVDVVGDGSCTDSFGNVIYDPYPTIGSGGFDLEAVGVINFGNDCYATAMNSGGITLQFSAPTNRLYRLQRASSLVGAEWNDIGGTVTGRNETATISDSNLTGTVRYYRVVREVAP